MEKVRSFIRKVMEIIVRPEMRILPGQLAFFFVVSIIPLIALLGAIASSFSVSIEPIKEILKISTPTGVDKLLIGAIESHGLNFNMGAFFISAFILASNGTNSIINASNEIYKIKPKHFLRRRSKAIIMTFLLLTLLTFLLLVPVFGDTIFEIIKEQLNNQGAINFIHNVYQLAKYPISIVIIYFNIKLLYVIAPDAEIPSFSATKGALFTTTSWIIASEVYSLYVATFTKYDVFYGSISNILVLLLYVYLLSYIFVLGLIINAGVYQNNKEA